MARQVVIEIQTDASSATAALEQVQAKIDKVKQGFRGAGQEGAENLEKIGSQGGQAINKTNSQLRVMKQELASAGQEAKNTGQQASVMGQELAESAEKASRAQDAISQTFAAEVGQLKGELADVSMSLADVSRFAEGGAVSINQMKAETEKVSASFDKAQTSASNLAGQIRGELGPAVEQAFGEFVEATPQLLQSFSRLEAAQEDLQRRAELVGESMEDLRSGAGKGLEAIGDGFNEVEGGVLSVGEAIEMQLVRKLNDGIEKMQGLQNATQNTFQELVERTGRGEQAIQSATRKVDSMEAAFNDLKQRANAVGLETNEMFKTVEESANDAALSLDRVDRVQGSISKSGATMRSSLASSSNNLAFELTQAAQDARFGLAGVANQIPLISEQFSQMTKKAGSTSGALSKLASTFMGPVGIIAGVTLALPLLGDLFGKLSKAGDEAKSLSEKLDNASRSFFDLADSAEDALKVTEGFAEDVVADLSNVVSELEDRLVELRSPAGAGGIAPGATGFATVGGAGETLARLQEQKTVNEAARKELKGKLRERRTNKTILKTSVGLIQDQSTLTKEQARNIELQQAELATVNKALRQGVITQKEATTRAEKRLEVLKEQSEELETQQVAQILSGVDQGNIAPEAALDTFAQMEGGLGQIVSGFQQGFFTEQQAAEAAAEWAGNVEDVKTNTVAVQRALSSGILSAENLGIEQAEDAADAINLLERNLQGVQETNVAFEGIGLQDEAKSAQERLEAVESLIQDLRSAGFDLDQFDDTQIEAFGQTFDGLDDLLASVRQESERLNESTDEQKSTLQKLRDEQESILEAVQRTESERGIEEQQIRDAIEGLKRLRDFEQDVNSLLTKRPDLRRQEARQIVSLRRNLEDTDFEQPTVFDEEGSGLTATQQAIADLGKEFQRIESLPQLIEAEKSERKVKAVAQQVRQLQEEGKLLDEEALGGFLEGLDLTKKEVQEVRETLKKAGDDLGDSMSTGAEIGAAAFQGAMSPAINEITSQIENDFAKAITDAVLSALSSAAVERLTSLLSDIGQESSTASTVAQGASAVGSGAPGAASTGTSDSDAATATAGTAGTLGSLGSIGALISAAVGNRSLAGSLFGNIEGVGENILATLLPGVFGGGRLFGIFAEGGPVSGPGGPRDDRIPALLSDDEFVMNARSAKAAPDVMHALNQNPAVARSLQNGFGRVQTFSDGGRVGSASALRSTGAGSSAGMGLELETEIKRINRREFGVAIREDNSRRKQYGYT